MIFVSISNTSIEKCIELIEKYKNVELRLDLIKPDIDDIGLLLSKSETSICAYITENDSKTSLNYILKAIEFGADVVDFGLNMHSEDISHAVSHAKNHESKIMLSYHNFELTPEKEFLEGLINEAETYSPDMIKIACLCKNDHDNEKLLSLMKINDRTIPVPMGDMGKKGRLKAYFYGSPIVYAYPDEDEPTAPGQLPFSDYQDMDKIISIIYR
ncbi:MAG: type I 3-dehydroquinate dehydratase [Candidatus Delongbacteria bacterium]|nr:type I 3-dehydroquinate dehydratase [Candidatus Delongbacteria bacterium]MCG2759698.1 type I 3-dehydroquinate dehydratase [Candidatus Delongbacteria bacterium]